METSGPSFGGLSSPSPRALGLVRARHASRRSQGCNQLHPSRPFPRRSTGVQSIAPLPPIPTPLHRGAINCTPPTRPTLALAPTSQPRASRTIQPMRLDTLGASKRAVARTSPTPAPLARERARQPETAPCRPSTDSPRTPAPLHPVTLRALRDHPARPCPRPGSASRSRWRRSPRSHEPRSRPAGSDLPRAAEFRGNAFVPRPPPARPGSRPADPSSSFLSDPTDRRISRTRARARPRENERTPHAQKPRRPSSASSTRRVAAPRRRRPTTWASSSRRRGRRRSSSTSSRRRT